MKATQEKIIPPPFRPVVVTLETQEEVDKFYAMFNSDQIANVLLLPDWCDHIDDYISREWKMWFDRLQKILRDTVDDD